MNKLHIKLTAVLSCIIALGLVGCEQDTPTDKLEVTPKVAPATNQVAESAFTITSKGTFKAGYDNTVREIFILKDNKTGEEFLGVTDCTLIKRINKKREDALEAVSDALESIGDIGGD
jgi:hypothetical protein